MRKILVACYDKVAEKINEPFVADNFETAKRMVRQTLVQSPGLRAMAADLELRQLCTIDFSNGMVDARPESFALSISLVDLLNDVTPDLDDDKDK